MTEKRERKPTEETEWGAWFEKLIRGEIRRDAKVGSEEQVEEKGTRTWRQQ